MVASVNVDDPYGRQIVEQARCHVVPYGINGGSEVRGRGARVAADGVTFDLEIGTKTLPVRLQLTGHFNVHNALAAAACCHGLGLETDQIIAGLEALVSVPGRFERVSEGPMPCRTCWQRAGPSPRAASSQSWAVAETATGASVR